MAAASSPIPRATPLPGIGTGGYPVDETEFADLLQVHRAPYSRQGGGRGAFRRGAGFFFGGSAGVSDRSTGGGG